MPTRTRPQGRARRKTSVRRAKKSAKPRAAINARVEENHIDGCDIDFAASDPTADADLPPAKGGIEPARRTARRRQP